MDMMMMMMELGIICDNQIFSSPFFLPLLPPAPPLFFVVVLALSSTPSLLPPPSSSFSLSPTYLALPALLDLLPLPPRFSPSIGTDRCPAEHYMEGHHSTPAIEVSSARGEISAARLVISEQTTEMLLQLVGLKYVDPRENSQLNYSRNEEEWK
eukprot:768586-Hanusia_phi.AAC.1